MRVKQSFVHYARDLAGDSSGEGYAQRFADLAESGADVHGEARLIAGLLTPGSRVLDAGCGAGRVAIELSRRGHSCVGVDVDDSMLAVARRQSSEVDWVAADLASLELSEQFDLVVAAGNVVPLLAAGTEAATVRRLAAHLAPHGVLVAGFGLDAAHLPLRSAPFGLSEYDGWCIDAGLVLQRRLADWDGAAYRPGGGYAVSLHRHTS
ncbi:MAG: class I SAM-dependent methyltransferase [Actinomycetota bacterium]|nr:class I SAM-dependent methyltransferase [Actinomycetota bacterium]